MQEWLERSGRVVGEECNSSRSGMQESAGVKKQVSN